MKKFACASFLCVLTQFSSAADGLEVPVYKFTTAAGVSREYSAPKSDAVDVVRGAMDPAILNRFSSALPKISAGIPSNVEVTEVALESKAVSARKNIWFVIVRTLVHSGSDAEYRELVYTIDGVPLKARPRR